MADDEFKWGDKTAAHLAKQSAPPSQEYEHRIVEAARVMVDKGHPSAVYQTQWSSGTTLWRRKDGLAWMIDRYGEVVR